jgi:hypothetical protein
MVPLNIVRNSNGGTRLSYERVARKKEAGQAAKMLCGVSGAGSENNGWETKTNKDGHLALQMYALKKWKS